MRILIGLTILLNTFSMINGFHKNIYSTFMLLSSLMSIYTLICTYSYMPRETDNRKYFPGRPSNEEVEHGD